MRERYEAGTFQPVTPANALREVAHLIERLTVDDCELLSDHMTNYLWSGGRVIYNGVNGTLQNDRKRMLEVLGEALERVERTSEVLDANTLYERGQIRHL